jgi:hypothetical protein
MNINSGRYQYEVSIKDGRELCKLLKNKFKQYEEENLLQCSLLNTKPTVKGIRFEVFLLGYSPNYTSNGTGITNEKWTEITKEISNILKSYLGNIDNNIYIDAWSADKKFGLNFETYIQFSEMII